MTQPIYALPDIHGHLDKLEAALSLIDQDGGSDARTVFLGDYIDRGPDSRGVIQRLIQGRADGRDWVFLKGNHDRFMMYFLEPRPRFDPYMRAGIDWFHPIIGGAETLASYGVEVTGDRRVKDIHAEALTAVPPDHIAFLQELEITHQTADLLFVHAGVRPGVPLPQQTEEDLLWIREEFHDDPRPYPWLIVHGHTPINRARHFGNRVDLDGGAAYGRPLFPAVFEGQDCWLLTDKGREKLIP